MSLPCPTCGEELTEEPPDGTRFREGSYRGILRGFPPRCPSGCQAVRPDSPFDLLELFRMAREAHSWVAKQKGLFRKRPVCRECRDDLVADGQEASWTLSGSWGTRTLELDLTGPALLCPRCQRRYIPPEAAKGDFARAIQETLGGEGRSDRGIE